MNRAVVLVASLFSATSWSYWEIEGERHRLEFAGSLRTTLAGVYQRSIPKELAAQNPSGLSQSSLRLTAEGSQGEWLKYQVHLLGQWSFASAPNGSTGVFSGSASRFRALQLERQLMGTTTSTAVVDVDRLNARFTFGPFDLTVGRQAINFSKAYFWNPLDVFLPFDPRAFDRDYKPGVDAVKLDVSFGELSGLNVVAAAGATVRLDPMTGRPVPQSTRWDVSWYASAAVARLYTTLSGVDLAVQGGKVYGGYQAGLGFAANVSDLGLRGEASYLWARDGIPQLLPDSFGTPREVAIVESHASGVLGLDVKSEESKVTLALEYGFNGGAVRGLTGDYLAATYRQNAGELASLSAHLVGVNLGYELLPVLVGKLGMVLSLTNDSAMVLPSVTWSISDEAELLLGATFGFGRRMNWAVPVPTPRSEFGMSPQLFYAQFKVYF